MGAAAVTEEFHVAIARFKKSRPVSIRDWAVNNLSGRIVHDSRINVQAEEAYVIIDVRAKRPVPLSDTGMIISRTYRNVESYNYNNGTLTYRGRIQFCYAHQTTQAKTDVTSTHDEASALRRKSLSKIASGEIDVGVAAGEFRQTANMVSGRLKQLSDAVTTLRRGNAAGVALALGIPNDKRLRRVVSKPPSQRLADGWLELHYGWAPLVSDIYGAIEQLRKTLLQGRTIGASTGQKYPGKGAEDGPRGSLELPGLARRARSHGTVSNKGIRTLAELGLVNPINIAWQLLPYSFVVDWVLPVSEILSGLTATAGLSNVWTSVITEKRSLNYIPAGWITCSQEIKRTSYSESFGTPIVDFRKVYAPSERVIADGVALLAQRMGRKAR